MKRSHVSPTVLVLIYLVLVIGGTSSWLTRDAGLLPTVLLGLDIVVLMALLLVAGSWAREVGILASWLKIAVGGLLIVLGAISLLTLNVSAGLFALFLGAIAIGLGFWTIGVLRMLAAEARIAARPQQVETR